MLWLRSLFIMLEIIHFYKLGLLVSREYSYSSINLCKSIILVDINKEVDYLAKKSIG